MNKKKKINYIFLKFINLFDDVLTRKNEFGHFTASAWVLNKDKTKMIVVRHNIYKAYIYPGGHADGESDLLSVAIREVKEQLDNLNQYYEFQGEKLKIMSSIGTKSDKTKQRFFQNYVKIALLNNLSEKQKIEMIISYGVLVDYFYKIHEKNDAELFMLSACSTGLDLEDYTYYIGILSDEQVSQGIVNKTSDLMEQVNIAYDIMDSQIYFADFITTKNYDYLVNNAISIINNYSIQRTK